MTWQLAAASAARPEPQSEMFASDIPERERTTLGNLRAHGKNARVPVNRVAASSTSRAGNGTSDTQQLGEGHGAIAHPT